MKTARLAFLLVALVKVLNGAANDIVITQFNSGGSGTKQVVFSTANNGLLATTGAGVPTILTTLPTGVQDNITRTGTIVSGTWNAGLIPGQYGGTGVANTGKTITLGGNFETSGAFGLTLTLSGATNVTLPTTGTVATLSGTEDFRNKTFYTPIVQRMDAPSPNLGAIPALELKNAAGNPNERTEIGFGYKGGGTYYPVIVGHRISVASGNTKGTWYVATRNVTTDTAPTTTLEVSTEGIARTFGDTRVSTQFDKTNTTLADVTGLTSTLEASQTYRFRAVLFVDADATGGHKYAIAGTATATAVVYQVNSIKNATNAFILNSRQTALGGAAGEASGTAYFTTIEGVITVNAAGTLTVQFAQNAANGTSSVLVGSTLSVWQLN